MQVLHSPHYDIKRLWQSEAWQEENLSAILPPEGTRDYSISSNLHQHVNELHLTVARFEYSTENPESHTIIHRQGTGSRYLLEEQDIVTAIHIDQQNYFRLPDNAQQPIIMIAGGAGISTFRSFFHDKSRHQERARNVLFFATQDRNNFYYQQEIEALVAENKLQCEVIFSAEAVRTCFNKDTKQFDFIPGTNGYIDSLLFSPENQELLWECLQLENNEQNGAKIYVCGQVPFAKLIMESLIHIIKTKLARKYGRQNVDREAKDMFYKISAQKRLLLDIFTARSAKIPQPGSGHFRAYPVSEIAKHNNEQQGYWIIVNGLVYDMSDFRFLHYGGDKIINAYAGCDATVAYQQVQHHKHSEVESMLDMYKIGMVKEPVFATHWEIAYTNQGLEYLSLYELYSVWKNYLFLIIQAENTLLNNFSIESRAITGKDHSRMTKIKFNLLVDLHQQFLLEALPEILSEPLLELWYKTLAFWAPDEPLNQLSNILHQFFASEQGMGIKNSGKSLWQATKTDKSTEETEIKWRKLVGAFQQADLELVRSFKEVIVQGVLWLENNARLTINRDEKKLIRLLESFIDVLENYAKNMRHQVFSLL